MRRSALTIGCATIALALPATATAGGWWTSIRVDRATVLAGQRVKAHANVSFSSVDSVEAAESGEQTFYVYLLRGFDYSIVERAMRKASPGNWWSVGEADAFRVGRVVIGGSDSNFALAHASFQVPGLEPGTYAVMFCDAGCVRPLADTIPMADFSIVADPVVARLATRIERLEQRNFAQAQKLLGASASARETRLASETRLARAHARITALERQLAGSRRSVWAELRWLVPGLLLGVLAAVLYRRRPRGPVDGHLGDDELRDLLASASRRSRLPA